MKLCRESEGAAALDERVRGIATMHGKTLQVGRFLISGPPADGALITKVFLANAAPTVEETDRRFEDLEKLQELMARTKRAIEALGDDHV